MNYCLPMKSRNKLRNQAAMDGFIMQDLKEKRFWAQIENGEKREKGWRSLSVNVEIGIMRKKVTEVFDSLLINYPFLLFLLLINIFLWPLSYLGPKMPKLDNTHTPLKTII